MGIIPWTATRSHIHCETTSKQSIMKVYILLAAVAAVVSAEVTKSEIVKREAEASPEPSHPAVYAAAAARQQQQQPQFASQPRSQDNPNTQRTRFSVEQHFDSQF